MPLSTMTNTGMYNILGSVDPGPLIQCNFETLDELYGETLKIVQGQGNLTFCYQTTPGGDLTEARFTFSQNACADLLINVESYTLSGGIGSTELAMQIAYASKDVTLKGNLELESNKVLKVGSNKVVGARQSSVADATEDLASVKTQLNLALAALRAHGLIAT